MQEFNFWGKCKVWQKILFLFLSSVLGIFLLSTSAYFFWQKQFEGKIYPGVKIAEKDFGGKSPKDIKNYFQEKNKKISLTLIFHYPKNTISLSAQEINWGYDENLMAGQAFSFGRSGNFLSDIRQKIQAAIYGFSFRPAYHYDGQKLSKYLAGFREEINIAPQEGLFHFEGGQVTAFVPSKDGQIMDTERVEEMVASPLFLIEKGNLPSSLKIEIPVKTVKPKVSTVEANNLGIKELVASGSSRFLGSITNRIYNIQLAASRLNGILVAPGEVFSFNKALGDVSKLTGYKEAYIIKDGRTILGDGGGVCQVSTTLFRALLNAGLPITERHAHSYRVGYYEQGSPPGIDASVYAPSWDLKFKNGTANYLLIQTLVDTLGTNLVFELYGVKDGRTTTLTNPILKNPIPPPEDLYQDDPNLPKGEIKQVDWKAWGADLSFSREVKREGETLTLETFSSHYQPWQSVFLRGTKE